MGAAICGPSSGMSRISLPPSLFELPPSLFELRRTKSADKSLIRATLAAQAPKFHDASGRLWVNGTLGHRP